MKILTLIILLLYLPNPLFSLAPSTNVNDEKYQRFRAITQKGWERPTSYQRYHRTRRWFRLAAVKMVQEELLRKIPSKATVIELGSGAGHLRDLVGVVLPMNQAFSKIVF